MRTIQNYRNHVTARGDKPKTVWMIVSNGQIIDWYLSKRYAERKAAERGDCTVERAA